MSGARVTELWRYPVKSLRGERLEGTDLTPDGVPGDRGWGVRDLVTGRILTARREPRLLLASARLGAHEGPVITLPDGSVLDGPGPATDAALCGWLGRDVALAGAAGDPGGRAEFSADATDDGSAAIEWTMPAGRYHDCTRCTMITRPQSGLDADVDMFRAVARHHAAAFGVLARIVTPGTVRLGDVARVGG